jgi:methyl-accepting chemotaxis protein
MQAAGITTQNFAAPQRRAPPASFFSHHGPWAPGVRLFRRLQFGAKASIISLAFLIPMLGALGWQLNSQYEDALTSRKDATRQHVEIAHGIIVAAHADEVAGKLSREDAQKAAKKTIASLRYNQKEYFWINDMKPNIVMHPIKPELDGKDASDMKDPNGLALFKEFADTVRRSKEGFVAYQWPKPGSDKPVDKLSYVKGFEPWGWVLGSGIYIDDIREAAKQRIIFGFIAILLSLSIAAYLFLSFYKVIDGGLKETRRHLRAITDGDLTTTPTPWGKDEAADLMNELAQMQTSLREVVRQVRESSDAIVSSSTEIASGTMDLSSRTEQATANLEEAAASMEQITSTVKATSEHTAEAAKVADHNATIAANGGEVMQDVVKTMAGIHASSSKISEIIGTIDAIAFQTNILALNAAVEAARAGEQGRGFAVVASEVRMLAQRSSEAAKEIKDLIVKSVEQVEVGSAVVNKAGETIAEIVSSSTRVNHILSEIATGSREQTLGIAQIGEAIHELDATTQQNSALVEETAAAVASMKEQALGLADEVRKFKLPA